MRILNKERLYRHTLVLSSDNDIQSLDLPPHTWRIELNITELVTISIKENCKWFIELLKDGKGK